MKKKFIFFDIDNTLVSHVERPHIPQQTRQAVRLLKANGHVPAIATGRGSFLTFLTAGEFEINNLVCANGAEIFYEGQEIYKKFFPEEHLQKFLELAKIFPELTAAVDEKFLYTNQSSGSFGKYFGAQAGYDCTKNLNELNRAVMCYLMIPPKYLEKTHGIFYSPPEGVILEFMNAFTEARHDNTSKWKGIEIFMQHTGASLNDVITFGDGPNDIEMLKNANPGVAVAGASEKVKEAAGLICGDIDEGGILEACESLGLI